MLGAELVAYLVLIRYPDGRHAQRLALVATPLWLLAVWLLSRLAQVPGSARLVWYCLYRV